MLLDLKDTHWLNRKYSAESLGELKNLGPWAIGSRPSPMKSVIFGSGL